MEAYRPGSRFQFRHCTTLGKYLTTLNQFLIFPVGVINARTSPDDHEISTVIPMMPVPIPQQALGAGEVVKGSLSRGNPAMSGTVVTTFSSSLGF